MSELELTCRPSPDDLAAIGSALSAFNEHDVGAAERQVLAVLIRDTDGSVTGGLAGFTAWGWLYVQQLFVPETARGKGLAGRMLKLAEEEAVSRACHGAWIDSFNPVALRTYQRAGYQIFGELPDFPAGRTRTFLKKQLPGAAR